MAILNTMKFIKMRFKTLSGYIKYALTSDSIVMKNGKDLQTEINAIYDNLTHSYIKATHNTALWMTSGIVPFVLSDKQGTCFSVDSYGQIVIGDNVSTVRVYASVGCGTGNNNRAWAHLKHNNTQIDSGLEYGTYAIIKLNNMIPVEKNDKISISFTETRGISIDGLSCNLIVEKIT